jgi:hypothetical protein
MKNITWKHCEKYFICEILWKHGDIWEICTGSSFSIVSGYGMDDRPIKIRSPTDAKDFSYSLCVWTGSGAHPASCTMGTGGPFPGTKARLGRDADHSPSSSAEVENEQELYLLSSQAPLWHAVVLVQTLIAVGANFWMFTSLICV